MVDNISVSVEASSLLLANAIAAAREHGILPEGLRGDWSTLLRRILGALALSVELPLTSVAEATEALDLAGLELVPAGRAQDDEEERAALRWWQGRAEELLWDQLDALENAWTREAALEVRWLARLRQAGEAELAWLRLGLAQRQAGLTGRAAHACRVRRLWVSYYLEERRLAAPLPPGEPAPWSVPTENASTPPWESRLLREHYRRLDLPCVYAPPWNQLTHRQRASLGRREQAVCLDVVRHLEDVRRLRAKAERPFTAAEEERFFLRRYEEAAKKSLWLKIERQAHHNRLAAWLRLTGAESSSAPEYPGVEKIFSPPP